MFSRPERRLARSGSSKCRDTFPVYRIRVRTPLTATNCRSVRSRFGYRPLPSRYRQQAPALRLYLTWTVTSAWLEFPAEVSTSRLAPLVAVAGTTMFTW